MNFKSWKIPALMASLVLALSLASCKIPILSNTPMMTDMPHIDESAPDTPAAVVAGPYIADMGADYVTVVFVTDRPVSGGLRVRGPKATRVWRTGRPETFHSVRMEGLEAGETYTCKVLLKEGEGDSFNFHTPSQSDGRTSLAVAYGTPEAGDFSGIFHLIHLKRCRQLLLLGSQIEGEVSEKNYLDKFFVPNRKQAEGLSLFHAPDLPVALPRLFPGVTPGRSHAVESGAVLLLMASAEDLKDNYRTRFAAWVAAESRKSKAPWKVVVMPNSPLVNGPRGVDVPLLEELSPVFEDSGINMVLSTAPNFYHRTVPVGTGDKLLRYVTLASFTPRTAPESESDFTAAQSSEARLYLIDADENSFVFQACDFMGRVIDRSVVRKRMSGPDSAVRLAYGSEAPIDRLQLFSDSWSETSQKRELAAVVRQACQAVPNPKNPGRLPILIKNPSPIPFKGEISWLCAGTMFDVTPQKIGFDLQPGEAIRSTFAFAPNSQGKGRPVLQATSDKGLTASEKVTLGQLRMFTMPVLEGDYIVDGMGDEKFWQSAAFIGEFYNLNGSPSKGDKTYAWVALATDGIRVRFICAGKPPVAKTSGRDAKVWQDDSVEIFLDPLNSGRDFYQFSLSASQATFDQNSLRGPGFNPDWLSATRVGDNGFEAEILIPYDAIGLSEPPATGTIWGINLTRNNYATGKCQVLQATPTYGSNGRPGCYLKAAVGTK